MRAHRLWTQEEDALVLKHYPDHPCSWAGWRELLPERTVAAIESRAKNLGIRYEGPRVQYVPPFGRNRFHRHPKSQTAPREWGVEPIAGGLRRLTCDGEPTGKVYRFEGLPVRMQALARGA